MYLETWIFWTAIVIISLLLFGTNALINDLKNKLELESERSERERKLLDRKIRELERWLAYYHVDSVGEEAKERRDKESSRRAKEAEVLYWCKQNKKDKKETDKILKESM